MAFKKLDLGKTPPTIGLEVGRQPGVLVHLDEDVPEIVTNFEGSNVNIELNEAEMSQLIERVVALARLDEDDLLELMSSKGAGAVLGIGSPMLDADAADQSLQSWDEIQSASPQPLDEAQYQRFLQGLDIADAPGVQAYGTDLERDA